MCVTYLFQTFTHQMICVHPTDAPEILHFPGRFTWTPGLFYFGFSAHLCDMCFIFASASHIYSGHLSTTLFVYILQMFQKFHIFLGHLPAHHGCFSQVFCIFSQDNYLDTRVVFFFRFSAHPWDIYICVSYLFKTFTHQIICAHLSNHTTPLPISTLRASQRSALTPFFSRLSSLSPPFSSLKHEKATITPFHSPPPPCSGLHRSEAGHAAEWV